MKKYVIPMIIGFILLSNCLWSSGSSEEKNNIVFAIGEIDKSGNEFNWVDFRDIRNVKLIVDGFVDPKLFPQRLIHSNGHYSPNRGDAVEEILLEFYLKKDTDKLVLMLSRAGDSDTEVSVNGNEIYRITSEMLGSAEGGVFGLYELDLGSFNKGSHLITLKMPDDGLGYNGSYKWDAIILRKE
jgi:hypothetical protein